MTNLKGIRVYKELSASGDQASYANKDISSLAIIAPFRITARVRLFTSLPFGNDGYFYLAVEYGGASDDNWQVLRLRAQDDNNVDILQSIVNGTNSTGSSGNTEGISITALTQEDWLWIEIECDADRNITVKSKDDNTTTRPTTWDNTDVNTVPANATPTQELQTVEVRARLDSNNAVTARVIMEVDEIYVTQD